MRRETGEPICAVILAAGEGRSLYPLTKDMPKALLSIGGTTILERLFSQLRELNISDFVFVVGHERETVVELLSRLHLPGVSIRIVENDRYRETNTLYSLSLAAPACAHRPILLIDGDIVCEKTVFDRIVHDKSETILAADSGRLMGAEEMKVRFGHDRILSAIGKSISKPSAESLGISRFSARHASELFKIAAGLVRRGEVTAFYEEAFLTMCERGHSIRVLDVSGLKWEEIDFLTDYEEALRIFGSNGELSRYREDRRPRPQYLFCPGPVLVSGRVKDALSRYEIGHRESEFSELLNRVRLKLSRVFGVHNFHRYTTVVITGSGSAANEAVLGSAGVGKRLLIVSNGEFGERWIELANFLEIDTKPLKLRWGQPFPLEKIEQLLKKEKIDAVCMIHHETSTGMLNPLREVAELAKRFRKEFFVDAVSSIGAVPVEVEDLGITFCTGSANKAIASVPGLSFVCGSRTAFDALKTVKPRSAYLNLYKHFDYNERKFQTPNTPAVNLFFALEVALDQVLEPDIESTFERYRSLATQLRKAMRKMGLQFFIPEEKMAPVLTTVELPAGFDAETFHDGLKRHGFITYPGKGILQHRVFQVANIGEISQSQVDAFLKALEQVIR